MNSFPKPLFGDLWKDKRKRVESGELKIVVVPSSIASHRGSPSFEFDFQHNPRRREVWRFGVTGLFTSMPSPFPWYIFAPPEVVYFEALFITFALTPSRLWFISTLPPPLFFLPSLTSLYSHIFGGSDFLDFLYTHQVDDLFSIPGHSQDFVPGRDFLGSQTHWPSSLGFVLWSSPASSVGHPLLLTPSARPPAPFPPRGPTRPVSGERFRLGDGALGPLFAEARRAWVAARAVIVSLSGRTFAFGEGRTRPTPGRGEGWPSPQG